MAAANYVFIPYDYSRRQHDAIVERHGHLVVVAMIYSDVYVADHRVGIGVRFADNLPSLPRGWRQCTEGEAEKLVNESVTSSTYAFYGESSRCRLRDLLPMMSEGEVHEVEGDDWVPGAYRRGREGKIFFSEGKIMDPRQKCDYIDFWDHWHSSSRYRLRAKFLYRKERFSILMSRGFVRMVPRNQIVRTVMRLVMLTAISGAIGGLVTVAVEQCFADDGSRSQDQSISTEKE